MMRRLLVMIALICLMMVLVIMQINIPIIILGVTIPLSALIFCAAAALGLVLFISMGWGC